MTNMVSPNWPSDDDPNYTPDFTGTSSNSDMAESDSEDLEALHDELDEIAANE